MTSTLLLRIIDAALALFWLGMLVQSLRAGRLGGFNGYRRKRHQRPRQYWFGIFVLGLMVVHFAGLAIAGQKL